MNTEHRTDHKFRYWVLVWFVAVTATIFLFTANLFLSDLNVDEGWYLYASRLVSEGKLPYIDFASTQGPLMPLVYAAVYPLVERWGMAGGRLFTAILGFITIILSAVLAGRIAVAIGPQTTNHEPRTRNLAAFLAFTLIGVNVYQSYFCTIVKTYALTGLFLVLGFLALSFTGGKRRMLWGFLSGVLLAFAAGTRTSAGVILPAVLICMVIGRLRNRGSAAVAEAMAAGGDRIQKSEEEKTESYQLITNNGSLITQNHLGWFWFMLGAVLTLCAIFVPFLITAPGALRFALIEYHIGREVGGAVSYFAYKAGFISRVVQAYFVAIGLGMILGLYSLLTRRKSQGNGSITPTLRHSDTPILSALWLSVVAVTIVHICAPFPYDDYQVIVFPLFAVALSALAARIIVVTKDSADQVSGPAEGGMNFRLAAPKARFQVSGFLPLTILLLCLASAFSSPINHKWFIGERDRIWWPLKKDKPLTRLQKVGELLRSVTNPGDILLTQDTYLAVESGLTLPKGLELGPFSYYPDWSREKAVECHVLNKDMFVELLTTTDARVAAFSGWGLAIRSPGITELTKEEQRVLRELVRKRYIFFRVIDNFGHAATKLLIYLRK